MNTIQIVPHQVIPNEMAYFVVFGITLLLSSQILSTIVLQDLAQDGVRILLLLGVLILGIVQAVLIMQENTIGPHNNVSMIHALSWMLIVPLIVYLFQSNLNGKSEGRFSLWLLLILAGGAFFCLFAVKKYPIAIYGFFGLLAAAVLLEIYQVSRSTLTTERQALTIALFLSWLAYGVPQLYNSINKELQWGFNDILSILLFLYFLLQEQ